MYQVCLITIEVILYKYSRRARESEMRHQPHIAHCRTNDIFPSFLLAPQLSLQVSQTAEGAIIIGAIGVYTSVAGLG